MAKRFTSPCFKAAICAALAVSFLAQRGYAQEVKTTEVPAAIIIYRTVTGPYSLHPEVFQQLMEYVGKNYAAAGACFGIYPVDPDAVESKNLKWQVGVRVVPGRPMGYGKSLPLEKMSTMSDAAILRTLRDMKRPDAPYQLRIMSATTAVVSESTVAKAGQDGLDLIPWMARNGYVQTGPTRMEYLSHEGPPSEIKVAIIVPIKQRATKLKSSS
jgi:hypothetical protein